MHYPANIAGDYQFPEFALVQVKYPRKHIQAVEAECRQCLDQVLPTSGIQSGESVAIGVGSRGIGQLDLMVRAICKHLSDLGAKPVIIPAMGSHGGAASEGQTGILQALNITPEQCGAPIQNAMAVKQIATVLGEVPVYFSMSASQMDHCICINRIKPHSKFKAAVESGLLKMLVVGLGKHQGALTYHQWALKYGFFDLLCAMGEAVIGNSNFRFGIGVVENAYDQPYKIEAIEGPKIFAREKVLLSMAKRQLPRLPLKKLDVLIVNCIGKEISGAGMDPNVTGRAYDLMESDFSRNLKATRLGILDLSPKTGGNALGLGYADVITEKLFQKIDYDATLINALTSLSLRKAYIPPRLPNDRKVIQACFTTIGPVPAEKIRAVIVKDTKHVTRFWVSAALRHQIENLPNAEILKIEPLRFDANDNLQLTF